jgi:hypothetical protein
MSMSLRENCLMRIAWDYVNIDSVNIDSNMDGVNFE